MGHSPMSRSRKLAASIANRKQRLIAAEVDASAGDRRRRNKATWKGILRDDFGLASGSQDEHFAGFAEHVDFSIGADWGREENAIKPLLPDA